MTTRNSTARFAAAILFLLLGACAQEPGKRAAPGENKAAVTVAPGAAPQTGRPSDNANRIGDPVAHPPGTSDDQPADVPDPPDGKVVVYGKFVGEGQRSTGSTAIALVFLIDERLQVIGRLQNKKGENVDPTAVTDSRGYFAILADQKYVLGSNPAKRKAFSLALVNPRFNSTGRLTRPDGTNLPSIRFSPKTKRLDMGTVTGD